MLWEIGYVEHTDANKYLLTPRLVLYVVYCLENFAGWEVGNNRYLSVSQNYSLY